MNNYLLYPDCFTEDNINHSRFAILKFLGIYNLRPPASIGVIIYTNKVAAFEMFQPFFKEFRIIKKQAPTAWNDLQTLQSLAPSITGNLLVCRSQGYLKQPVENLFQEIGQGRLLYCLQQPQETVEKPDDHLFEKLYATGIASEHLQNPSTTLYTMAQDSSTYFTVYKKRSNMDKLLRLFFLKNEEESTANLVKKAKSIDLEALEATAVATDRLPFLKRWMRRIWPKNSLLQHYRNKL